MAEVLRKEQCEDCQDSGEDNKVIYSDNSTHCFSCGKTVTKNGTVIKGGKPIDKVTISEPEKQKEYALIDNGEYVKVRGLPVDICKQYGIQLGTYCSNAVVVFNRYRDGQLVRQKLRTPDKKIWWTGPKGEIVDMFGSQSFGDPKDRHLVVTEGEFDAPSCAYALSGVHTYHCTSLDSGAKDVKKWINQHYEKLQQYKSIVLCLDNDVEGNAAKEVFLEAFSFGLLRVVKLPLKDANEMVTAGKIEDLKWAILKSEPVKPSQVVTVKDIIDEALIQPKSGKPWPWKGWTEVTYGMRPGVYVVVGPEGTGKTELVKEITFNNLNVEPYMQTAIFSFEQKPKETLQRLAGACLNKRIYIPGEEWDREAIASAMKAFDERVYWYSYKGVLRFTDIVKSIYYLAHAKEVKFFCLDNLTAMLSYPYIEEKRCNETEFLGHVINTLKQISVDLDLCIVVISHNSNDNMSKQVYVTTSPKNEDEYLSRSAEEQQEFINRPGTTWESGRVATLENIYGSGTIKKIADYVVVLARNRVSQDDIEHRTLITKWLKCRMASEFEGRRVDLLYMPETGRLVEIAGNTRIDNSFKHLAEGIL